MEAQLGLRGDQVECVDGLQFTEEVGSSPELPTGKDCEEGHFRARCENK